MKEQSTAPPPLGVAGKLNATESQVGVSLRLDLLAKRPAECLAVRSHDEAVCVADGVRGIAGVDAHHQRVIQATGPLQDGASPADSPQDRDAQPFAGFGVALAFDGISVTHDSEGRVRLPKTQHRTAPLPFTSSSIISSHAGLCAGLGRLWSRVFIGRMDGRRYIAYAARVY